MLTMPAPGAAPPGAWAQGEWISVPNNLRLRLRSFKKRSILTRFGLILLEFRGEIGQPACFNRAAQTVHQLLVVVEVVQRVQPCAEDLIHALEMVQVGAREVAAGVARAFLVERFDLVAVTRVPQLDDAVAGIDPAIARVPGRQHAVEHVDARRHRHYQVVRRADSHEIARTVRRQLRRGVLKYPRHLALGLAHRQPADRVAVETDLSQAGERFVAQRLVHAALYNSEQRVAIAFMRTLRALGPAQRELHRITRLFEISRIWRALVEHHDDVGIKHPLDAHGLLGREKARITIDRRLEAHPLFRDLPQLAEAVYLVAARVGQDRAVPA